MITFGHHTNNLCLFFRKYWCPIKCNWILLEILFYNNIPYIIINGSKDHINIAAQQFFSLYTVIFAYRLAQAIKLLMHVSGEFLLAVTIKLTHTYSFSSIDNVIPLMLLSSCCRDLCCSFKIPFFF